MKPKPMVVDSSVALKWLKPEGEEHAAEARALLDAHEAGRQELTAPAHLLLEVMNALWAHRATAAQIQRAVELLIGLRMTFIEADPALLARAAEMAVDHRITVYDAVFAALAERLDCELVTADRQLASSGACRVRKLA